MIPKRIHYCWFGHGEMSEHTLKCIESWKIRLPDYDLILWNEDNFDININQYVKEAYESKKYAFVTDYVRLFALYYYGGIYMDTDIEVVKPLDPFLKHRAFAGCEDEQFLQTGLLGAEKNHPWIGELLKGYIDRKFLLKNGKPDKTPNPIIITRFIIDEYGWIPQNKYQVLKDDLHIYPIEVFCAKNASTGEILKTDQTYTIHHFSASWVTEEDRKMMNRRNRIKKILIKVIGERGLKMLLRLKK